ncbi:hypothetical protein BJY01DRAFT_68888 [Aspergillus pseudoustus]|uniref:Uncharacterized protein n=1 Tax=Aspergillus pseudoustus TaxID=1810923 RepID=A0ABR4J6F4_9EURO
MEFGTREICNPLHPLKWTSESCGHCRREPTRWSLEPPFLEPRHHTFHWRVTMDAGSRFTAELAKRVDEPERYYEQFRRLLRFVESSLGPLVVQASLLFFFITGATGLDKKSEAVSPGSDMNSRRRNRPRSSSIVLLTVTGSIMSSLVAWVQSPNAVVNCLLDHADQRVPPAPSLGRLRL